MHDDSIWRAFAETGDPIYYLLVKTFESGSSRSDTGKGDASPSD